MAVNQLIISHIYFSNKQSISNFQHIALLLPVFLLLKGSGLAMRGNILAKYVFKHIKSFGN
jgi:hypothetical protein